MEDEELESYEIPQQMLMAFVWKHKIFQECTRYLATIVGLPCEDGKVPIKMSKIQFMYPDIPFGIIRPGYEYILWVIMPPPVPGEYDWFVVTETDDTNSIIPPKPDGDIDDICGANLGLPPENPIGPLVFGPEPNFLLDPDPGGNPPGRRPGENGVTRGWCFRVF